MKKLIIESFIEGELGIKVLGSNKIAISFGREGEIADTIRQAEKKARKGKFKGQKYHRVDNGKGKLVYRRTPEFIEFLKNNSGNNSEENRFAKAARIGWEKRREIKDKYEGLVRLNQNLNE